MATKNQPVKEVRLGRIKAVIWKNPGSNGNGPLLNTRLARLYKDPESDNWKESQSLGRDDLLLAAAEQRGWGWLGGGGQWWGGPSPRHECPGLLPAAPSA